MSGLDVFAPEPRVVRAGGRAVSIVPLRLRGMQRFAAAAAPIAGLLAVADYEAVFARQENAAFDLLRAATDLSETELDAVWPDEAVDLLAAIYEVNADFFVRRLRPALARAATGAGAILAAAEVQPGPKPLPGSSSTAMTSDPALI